MTRYSLKKKIILKFGSWHNFARLVGADVLRGKTPAEIDAIASRLHRDAPGVGIAPEKIKVLKTHIMKAGGVIAFCRQNRDFAEQSVFQILQGRRKRMSPVVRRLFAHFGL